MLFCTIHCILLHSAVLSFCLTVYMFFIAPSVMFAGVGTLCSPVPSNTLDAPLCCISVSYTVRSTLVLEEHCFASPRTVSRVYGWNGKIFSFFNDKVRMHHDKKHLDNDDVKNVALWVTYFSRLASTYLHILFSLLKRLFRALQLFLQLSYSVSKRVPLIPQTCYRLLFTAQSLT